MTPRKLRKDYAEKATGPSEPAQRELSEVVTAAILKGFVVKRRAADIVPATGREFQPKG